LENRELSHAEMTQQQLGRLFELFLACWEMDSETRSEWLHGACQGDLSLQRSVERLIREDLCAEGFLSRPSDFVTRVFAFTIAEGQHFGRYTLRVLLDAAAWARCGRRMTRSWIAPLP
jgi:hypothetical protein